MENEILREIKALRTEMQEAKSEILNAMSDEFVKHRKAMRVNYVTYEDMEKMIEQVKAEIMQELTQQSLI